MELRAVMLGQYIYKRAFFNYRNGCTKLTQSEGNGRGGKSTFRGAEGSPLY